VIWKFIINWLMGVVERAWVDLWRGALQAQARGVA
jgi:hypothetical protein